MSDIQRSAEPGELLGHPKGLFVLFLTEMWERFSYYGMRALLVLYLTKHFLFDREAAYGLYAAYITLVYITPVLGGALADQYLGLRKAVLVGGILLVIGHLGMAIEGEPVAEGGTPDPLVLNIFYLSLAFIIAGVGFLKANISSIVGELYRKTDPRRDGAYTIFYVGINIGAFIAPLLCGWIGETFGWSYGFGLAGIGMLAGLVVFVRGTPTFQGAGEPRDPALLRRKTPIGLDVERTIYAGTALGIAVIWILVRYDDLVGALLGVMGLLTVAYILFLSSKRLNAHEFQRVLVLFSFMFMNIIFWALFEQVGSSLTLYTDEEVNRSLFGLTIPASVFAGVNPFYIIALGPVFASLWTWLGKRGWEPSTPVKFSLGVLQVGLGFLVLVAGDQAAGDALTPVIFIFLIYLLHTTGELCLSPVGLSAVTRLSVGSMVGLMMGTWFLSFGAGNFASGVIAKATAAGGGEGTEQIMAVYTNVGWLAIGIAALFFLLSPILRKAMHLETIKDVDHSLAGQSEIGEPAAAGAPASERDVRAEQRP